MSYKDEIEVWQGDYGYDINAQLTDDEGNPFDLTGYTVVVRAAVQDATTKKWDRTCTITDATNGKVKWTVQSGDFDTAGEILTLTFVATKTGVEVSFGGLQIKVLWRVPA